MTQKWTIVPRRGILHLARFVLEDQGRGLFDHEHPMYRRLTAPERRELAALWRWLCQEQEHADADAAALERAARTPAAGHAPREPETPGLFGDEPAGQSGSTLAEAQA